MANQIIEERNKNGRFKSFSDLQNRILLSKSQIIALIKSGAIPSKNKRKTLEKYLISLYSESKFKEVTTLPTKKDLKNKHGIDIDKYIIGGTEKRPQYDTKKLLKDYNILREKKHAGKELERKQINMESNEKYLEDELFWEFQTLQVFINNNPFDEAYEYLVPFENINDGDECVVPGVIAKVQKKKDKSGKQFAFINIYSSFGLVEGIIWHSQYKEYEDLIKKGSQVTILCRKDSEEKILVKKMREYNSWLKDIVERNSNGRNV